MGEGLSGVSRKGNHPKALFRETPTCLHLGWVVGPESRNVEDAGEGTPPYFGRRVVPGTRYSNRNLTV